MSKSHQVSAGILLWQKSEVGKPDVFLTHPGGPYFAKKDIGYWGVPKGLIGEGEDVLTAALREFKEETGFILPENISAEPLGYVEKEKTKKIIHCFAVESIFAELPEFKSNTFKMEWPPFSGNWQEFPEVDKGEMMKWEKAWEYINADQRPFLERLLELTK